MNLNQETIKKELLAKNRYESITGQSKKEQLDYGLNTILIGQEL